MKNNKEVLSSVLKTTQMGQVGIRSVLDYAVQPSLRKALHSQLAEYDKIETEAHRLASQKGWKLPELSASSKMMSDMMSRMQLSMSRRDSKIADMMIIGNTRGMVKSMKNMHHHSRPDAEVSALSEKLLETERSNISQMEGFL